jgi:hypothetical protein
LDGFVDLLCELLSDADVPEETVFRSRRADVSLPGFFRPTKQWDIVIVHSGKLTAAVELKSLCGPSFGNNYNNRVEEALGSATDVWTAYREGAFQDSPEPFVGYFLLLEDHDKSNRAVKVSERHFDVFSEYRDASYAIRCEESIRRLVRERCYSAATFITSNKVDGASGTYAEPAADLGFERLAKAMCSRVVANIETLS